MKRIRAWWILSLALILLTGAGVAAGWYGYQEFIALSQKVVDLDQEVTELDGRIASTTVALGADIVKTSTALSSTLESQGKHVDAVTDKLTSLEKLQALDPQLLAKYSKVYFLNENYMPASLGAIPSEYLYFDTKTMQVLPQVLSQLIDMLDAAKEDDTALYVYSAYRSFDTQTVLKREYTVTFGAGTAGQFSADQGYSEHQLGTAVDLITPGLSGQLTQSFSSTEAYTWLTKNAHKYGFTLSYPPGNSYYIYEPWHWRYVGIKLATDLHKKGKYFYDLDQRTIDTYLASIFD